MGGKHATPIALMALLTLSAGTLVPAVGPIGTATAQDAPVTVTGVDVRPGTPAPGEQFTVTTNVTHAGGNSSVSITDVYVRDADSGTDEHARVEDLGSVGDGNTVPVSLPMSIGSAGSHSFRIHVVVERPNGETTTIRHPLSVTVAEPSGVLLSVPTTEATVGTSTPVNVTVSNGKAAAISGVELTLAGDGSAQKARRVTASIDSGVDRPFQFDVTFDETGPATVDARLTYTTDAGVTRTIEREATIDVVDDAASSGIQGTIELTSIQTSGGSVVTIQGEAANLGGTDVTSLLLSVEETDRVEPAGSSGEQFVGRVNASTFDTFEIIARADDDVEAIPVRMEYIVGGESRTRVENISRSSGGVGPDIGGAQRPERDERDPFGGGERTPPNRPGRGGGAPMGLLLPVVLVLGTVGGGYALWRRR